MLITKLNFRKREFLFQLFLVVIIFYLYSFSWHYPIYSGWDDIRYILRNKNLSFSLTNIFLYFSQPYFNMYHPLTMLSYMFDYNVWGFNSFGYHLQNIFWHTVAVIAVYKCFRIFEIKTWVAFFLCLIFAVHPQRVESVVWLSERKDVLCAAFYFLSILFFLKSDIHNKKSNYILSFLFYLLALLSKPMTISLPFILLLYMFYKNRTFSLTLYLRKLWLYFGVLFVFIPLTIYSQAVDNERITLFFRQLYVVLYNIKFYITTTILPTYMNPIYPRVSISDSIVSTSVFYIAAIFILIFLFVKSRKLFMYVILPLLLCYIIALLPVVGIVPFSFCDYTDRWSYIPSVFIWFPVGLILTRLLYGNNIVNKQLKTSFLLNKKVIFTVLFFYTFILIESNYQYQKIWINRQSIFSYAASNIPVNSIALKFLADIELEQGNYLEVLKIADLLEQNNNGSLDALYFKATVTYYLDKKNAIKELLFIKPYYKLIVGKNSDTEFRYIKILEMLIDSNFSIGNNPETTKNIDEILSYKYLDRSKRLAYMELKKELNPEINRKVNH